MGISANNVPPSGVVFALITIAAMLISHVSSSGRHRAVHVAQMTVQTTPCCVAARAAPKMIFLVKTNMREGEERVESWRSGGR